MVNPLPLKPIEQFTDGDMASLVERLCVRAEVERLRPVFACRCASSGAHRCPTHGFVAERVFAPGSE